LWTPQYRHQSGARSPALQRVPSDAGTRCLPTAPAAGPALDCRRARQGSAARLPAADSTPLSLRPVRHRPDHTPNTAQIGLPRRV
jgi:hypothetical protein